MNRDNIQYTIDLLKQAQNFNICHFQFSPIDNYVRTTEELHKCGNSACIAGYVALSPRWKELGNGVDEEGFPVVSRKYLGNSTPDLVGGFMKFWGLGETTTCAIIYGEHFRNFCEWNGISGMPSNWEEMTKENAISLFEQLLAKQP